MQKLELFLNVELADGSEFFVRAHRVDGPAIIWPDGTEIYRIYGRNHREDGPAKIFAAWTEQPCEWWLNNNHYVFEDWCKELNKSLEEIDFLKLKWNIT